MKKILILLIIPMIFLVTCTACEKKLNTYEEIDIEKFNQMIENKDTFILFVGSATCSHCIAYKEKVNKVVSNYQIKIYYIDINEFSNEQEAKFKSIINFEGTPTTVFIENGEEKKDSKGNVRVYRIDGNLSYDKVVEKIKKAGFIKD